MEVITIIAEILLLIKHAAGALTSMCIAGVFIILFNIMWKSWKEQK